MRKIILNLAISLDGYIADMDGGFDWIKGHGDTVNDTEEQFDFGEFVSSVDTVIMGRKAYDDSGALTINSIEGFKNKRIIVTTSRPLEATEGIEVYDGDICEFLKEMKKEAGKDIWLFGGGGSIDPIIKADMVDDYIIGIIPVILGKGRPLFLENNPMIELHLDSCTLSEGVTMLRYSKRQ